MCRERRARILLYLHTQREKMVLRVCVCVHYCSTYYKDVRVGGGG
jgi:hypothetical protein